ncbi:MAG: DNA topoisomerase IV subunit A, partial [Planctomycetota bacterium]
YMMKHKIKPTSENTFEDQKDSDPIIEDLEVLIGSIREELHLYAKTAGNMVGPITLVDKGDVIDCSRMGSGGYAIPSIVEPDIIQLDPKKCGAQFILHVEKGTVWQRFNEDRFWEKHNCLLTHGAGQPPRGVRRLLYRLHNELKLPVYCVLDNDPWGYYIYSVLKQGSINLAFESQRMAIPDAKYLGLRSIDLDRYELDSVSIKMNDSDKKRASQIAKYPWFEKKPKWQSEIKRMLKNDCKLEVESLISKDISYVTETYVPERLEAQDWLD